MPVHIGSNTKVYLVTTDLRSTTTDTPSNKTTRQVGSEIKKTEEVIANAHVLKEARITLPGDDYPIHRLGDGEHMPFMFVRAGEDVRQPVPRKPRVYNANPVRNAIYEKIFGLDTSATISAPQALTLRIELSKESFMKTKTPAEDIRVDVLFNGQLTHCRMWSGRLFAEDDGPPIPTAMFGGLRFHWLLERPWAIVPPKQNADGSYRHPTASAQSLESRWQMIQDQIVHEASARGVDKNGRKPPVARYLDELAKLAMPPELKDWSDPKGQSFGVLDVVLSYGWGSIGDPTTTFITEPTRMSSAELQEPKKPSSNLKKATMPSEPATPDVTETPSRRYNLRTVTPRKPATHKSGPTDPSHRSHHQPPMQSGPLVDTIGFTIISSEPIPPCLGDMLSSHGYNVHLGSKVGEPPELSTSSSTTRSSRQSSTSKRRHPSSESLFQDMMGSEGGLDMTSGGAFITFGRRNAQPSRSMFESFSLESMMDIDHAAGTPLPPVASPLTSSSRSCQSCEAGRAIDATADSLGQAAPHTPVSSRTRRHVAHASTVNRKIRDMPVSQQFHFLPPQRVPSLNKLPQMLTSLASPEAKHNVTAGLGSIGLDDPFRQHEKTDAASKPFEIPELSRDCAITYAQPWKVIGNGHDRGECKGEMVGAPKTSGEGVVRHVKGQRLGHFDERGILVGVRFLIV